jgi:hypothetical protein
LTDRDRRAVMLTTFVGIAAGSAALGELVYLALRWLWHHH